jgi:hypothetical protein
LSQCLRRHGIATKRKRHLLNAERPHELCGIDVQQVPQGPGSTPAESGFFAGWPGEYYRIDGVASSLPPRLTV